MLNLSTTSHWSGIDVSASSTGATAWRTLVALGASFALLALVILQLGDGGRESTVTATGSPVEIVATEGVDDVAPVGSAGVPVPTTAAPGTSSFAWRPVRAADDVSLDPRSLTTRFATDILGFAGPTVGRYQPFDAGSGLIEVRAHVGGPVTSVLLHRADAGGSWSVIGASSDHITIDQPALNGAVGDPFRVSGQAIAAGGLVELELWAMGDREPLLVREFVVRPGEEPDWFEGAFGWNPPAVAEAGAAVFRIVDPDTGSVSEAAVVPVMLPPAGP